MTLHVYTSLAKQFVREIAAAANHGIIDTTKAKTAITAIHETLDAERIGVPGSASPPAAEPLRTETGSDPLSAERWEGSE